MSAQMAIVLAFLVTLPLIILGYLLIYSSQTAVRTSVLRDEEQLAIRTAGELRQFIKRPQDLLSSTAVILGKLHTDIWKQETILVELALTDEIFGRITSLDMNGKEQATSELGTMLRDRSAETVFKSAVQNKFYMSDIYISENHTPYATMSVPIRSLGKITGVLAAEVNLRGFWRIVDDIHIGKTGRAYVVSKQGLLIADQDKKRVLANENLSNNEVVRTVLAGHTGSVEFTDPAGKKWLKAYAPIEELGWGVVVKQSADEAYSFLHIMKTESRILIAFSLFITLLISMILARMLVQPIKLLAQKMRLVAAGDLDQHLRAERNDEIGNLMNAFNQMTEKLKKARESEKLATIGTAATAIAHELKNSLVMAGTFIGLLPQRYTDKEFLKRFSTVVPGELENWKNMLQDISDFSRRSGFELSAFDLNDFMQNFVPLIEQRLTQRNIQLEVDVPSNLPVIKANGQKLKQVLINLVTNALEAMPEGGILKISVRTLNRNTGSVPSEEIEIKIQDNGKGISPNQLEQVFKPFYTTKTNGLGLGLAICREIMEQHGGKLELESKINVGTVFAVRLPVNQEMRVSK